jgi:hypothetical protein
MKIQIDVSKLDKLNITPNEFILMYIISINNSIHTNCATNSDLEKLQREGYIKIVADNGIVLRAKGAALLPSKVANVELWIEDWRSIWPIGVRSGGRPVRGNKADCLMKMTKFMESSEYTKDEIMASTFAYVTQKKHEDYKYMISADYFIRKDNCSLLESWCEDMKARGGKVEDFEKPSFNESV